MHLPTEIIQISERKHITKLFLVVGPKSIIFFPIECLTYDKLELFILLFLIQKSGQEFVSSVLSMGRV